MCPFARADRIAVMVDGAMTDPCSRIVPSTSMNTMRVGESGEVIAPSSRRWMNGVWEADRPRIRKSAKTLAW